MGAIPGWVVSGCHRCLPFRFASVAHSAFSSNRGGAGCRGNGKGKGKLKSFGMTFLENDDDNFVVQLRRDFSSVGSRSGMANPRHRRSSPPSPPPHQRHVVKTPSVYYTVIQFRRSVACYLFSPPNIVKGARGLHSPGTSRSRGGAAAKGARGGGSGSGGEDSLRARDVKYIDWWEQRMNECQKPFTRELIKRLVPNNILGLDSNLKHGKLKQGGFVHEVLGVKRRFPHEVILCRVGESYESSGYDACVLAEYAGLDPMGGLTISSSVPRASCPIENLRQTLDALTTNGFSVCIVEEVKGPSNARGRKERFISGHAHPGSPYVYGLAEADFDVDFPDPVSIIGISRSASGYCMISVVELMRCVSVQDQLTEEAVVAKLRTMPVQRLFLHKSLRDQSTETVRWGEFGEGGFLWAECRGQISEWYEFDPVSELLCKVREIYDLDAGTEFRRIVSPPGKRPRPLSVGTASQVGILPTHGVPSLLRVLFPPDMHGLCVAYFRDLLLNPPPLRVAACLEKAMRIMLDFERPIPDFQCVSAAKLVKLIGAKEANHLEFARIKDIAEDVLLMEKDPELAVCLGLLLDPTWLATGLRLEQEQLFRVQLSRGETG